MIPFKLRAALPAAYPAVRVQSYALKAMSDRGLTRTVSANRRNMPPLAGEVVRIQKYPCLLQHDSRNERFEDMKNEASNTRQTALAAICLTGYPEPSDTRLSNDAVIHGFNDFMTQCRQSPFVRRTASTTEPDTRRPACVCSHGSGWCDSQIRMETEKQIINN